MFLFHALNIISFYVLLTKGIAQALFTWTILMGCFFGLLLGWYGGGR